MMFTDESNILVVGGEGAIGRKLLETLPSLESVYVVDRNIDSTHQGNSRFIQCDLTDLNKVDSIKHQLPGNLSVIFLASSLVRPSSPENISNMINETVVGTVNLINVLARKISHFIYISSISVYGESLKGPSVEASPVNPKSIYGTSKACGELFVSTLCRHFGIKSTTIRLAQLFDLESAEHTLPHQLMNKLASRDNLKISCDPDIKRDYLHVIDFVELLKDMIKEPIQGIFNVGSGRGLSIGDLFKAAYTSFQIPFNLNNHVSQSMSSASSLYMESSKIHQTYDFRPKRSIEDWFNEKARQVRKKPQSERHQI